ncbi:MAG: cytidine deaminase [Deltaproteobacteria bacterium]|nr:MAG: cytidine deaminase [Deltaproteobacteria bacterium]
MTRPPEPPSPGPGAPGAAPDSLEARAVAAQRRSYAPYSKFRVGAAVRMSGEVFEGANIENASYGLTVCAERTALFAAVNSGAHRLEAIAVCTDASPPSSPCGACRQVLLEFAPDPAAVTVTAVNPRGERRSWTLAELIPDGFSGRELP